MRKKQNTGSVFGGLKQIDSAESCKLLEGLQYNIIIIF